MLAIIPVLLQKERIMAIDTEKVEEPKNPEIDREIPAEWKANIIAFACHYCAFAAADLAGVMSFPIPPM